MNVITKKEAFTKITQETKGRVFSAHFIKKDGSDRIMNCKLNVESLKKGGQMAYSPYERRLIPVVDTNLMEYRMINVETLVSLQMDGEFFSIADNE